MALSAPNPSDRGARHSVAPPARTLRLSLALALALPLAFAACTSSPPADSGSGSASGAASPTSAVPSVDTGPEPTPSPVTPVTGVPAGEAAAAQAAVRRYTAAAVAVLGGDAAARDELAAAAAGSALRDLLDQRREYAGRRWRVSGRAEVVEQTVVERRARPPRLVVAACVDTATVRVRDRSGAVVPTSSTPRTLNRLTVERRGGGWVVVAATLPDDPSC